MNEVVIGAPYPLTEEVIDHFNIDLVVRGMVHDSEGHKGDPYQVAKDKGIYKVRLILFKLPNLLTNFNWDYVTW